MIYLDTSVLAAYYCPEPASLEVERIILHNQNLAISDLTEIELLSAVSRKIREKNLLKDDANKIIGLFQSHVGLGLFQKISIQSEHFQIAKTWIAQFTTPLRTLDALHLSVASTQKATLFTADIYLAKAAKHFGITSRLISQK